MTVRRAAHMTSTSLISGACAAEKHGRCRGRYRSTTVDPTAWLRCHCDCHAPANTADKVREFLAPRSGGVPAEAD